MGGAGSVDLLGRWRWLRDLPRLESREFRLPGVPPVRMRKVAQVAQSDAIVASGLGWLRTRLRCTTSSNCSLFIVIYLFDPSLPPGVGQIPSNQNFSGNILSPCYSSLRACRKAPFLNSCVPNSTFPPSAFRNPPQWPYAALLALSIPLFEFMSFGSPPPRLGFRFPVPRSAFRIWKGSAFCLSPSRPDRARSGSAVQASATRSRNRTPSALAIRASASTEMFPVPRSTLLMKTALRSAFSASFSWLNPARWR